MKYFRKRYVINEERTGYKVHLTLIIKNYSKKDIGTYMCVATNSLGKAEGSVRIYGKLLLKRSESCKIIFDISQVCKAVCFISESPYLSINTK